MACLIGQDIPERTFREAFFLSKANYIYVLDTNVLLQDPYAVYQFQPHEVVIPAVVLEEVDSKKEKHG